MIRTRKNVISKETAVEFSRLVQTALIAIVRAEVLTKTSGQELKH